MCPIDTVSYEASLCSRDNIVVDRSETRSLAAIAARALQTVQDSQPKHTVTSVAQPRGKES